jgi:alpha/beta superfamily hydrolase
MPPLDLAGPAGRLEALIDEPEGRTPVRAAVALAHPHPLYGGTMHTKAVYQTAKALARIGCAVLRFNFRGVGASAGAYSEGIGEREDMRASLDTLAARYPGARLWSAGMSFGSWIAFSVGAADPRVSALIGISTPVDKYDFADAARSTTAKFLIHGEFDEICPLAAVRAFYASAAEPKELVVIETADHLFTGHVSQVAEAIEDLLQDF